MRRVQSIATNVYAGSGTSVVLLPPPSPLSQSSRRGRRSSLVFLPCQPETPSRAPQRTMQRAVSSVFSVTGCDWPAWFGDDVASAAARRAASDKAQQHRFSSQGQIYSSQENLNLEDYRDKAGDFSSSFSQHGRDRSSEPQMPKALLLRPCKSCTTTTLPSSSTITSSVSGASPPITGAACSGTGSDCFGAPFTRDSSSPRGNNAFNTASGGPASTITSSSVDNSSCTALPAPFPGASPGASPATPFAELQNKEPAHGRLHRVRRVIRDMDRMAEE